jgi:hypothetical protein
MSARLRINVLIALSFAFLLATLVDTTRARVPTAIQQARAQTHHCQDELGIPRTRVSSMVPIGAAYRAWVLALWRGRRDAYCAVLRAIRKPTVAVRMVFGDEAPEALAVARCETGGTYDTNARNGQYQGLFQMGDYARHRYGHGDTALEQARAAHSYYQDAGWSPWECAYITGVL